ncbi:hypothetical protein [Desulfovibrio sp. JC010]|uniref:hypothetical protein n=1 Tax=Desulfovibrio sp. JC010 TaxID=2593641 RepID=UPI0013D2853D|nr:hypothetical protein [Desulfovibrio sp. JC010]NDV26941.1 hypothetical protein [Desulfovibrio sp. JC010]
MSSGNPYLTLAQWLDKEAAEIRSIESRAQTALYDDKDDSAYRDLMRSKALKLASLAEQGGEVINVAEYPDMGPAMKRLERFSQSAAQSLEIGSVFFMSALLYPEDHKIDDPNDLEEFVAELRASR